MKENPPRNKVLVLLTDAEMEEIRMLAEKSHRTVGREIRHRALTPVTSSPHLDNLLMTHRLVAGTRRDFALHFHPMNGGVRLLVTRSNGALDQTVDAPTAELAASRVDVDALLLMPDEVTSLGECDLQ